MDNNAKRWLSVGILLAGALLWLALSVYPFQYGRFESLILAGLLVLAGFVEFVLDEALVRDG